MLLQIWLYNIAPVFFLIGMGYMLGKKFDLDIRSISKLSVYVFLPATLIVNLYGTAIEPDLLIPVAFTAIFVISLSLVSSGIARLNRYRDSRKNAFKNAVVFFNSGNMGLPLISLIFANTPVQEYAMSIQIMIVMCQNLLNYTLGFYNAARGKMDFRSAIKAVCKMPIVHAILLVIILKAIPYDMRNFFLWPAVKYSSDAMIAVNILILGIQLSRVSFNFKDIDVYRVALLRLCVAPLLAYLLIVLWGIDGVMAKALLINAALPTAVNTVLIAVEFQNEHEFAAQTVVVTTLLCLATLPLVIFLAQRAF